MNTSRLDFALGFLICLIICTAGFTLVSDYIKTKGVNQYLSGELKCVPDNFEPETLVCRSNVGK